MTLFNLFDPESLAESVFCRPFEIFSLLPEVVVICEQINNPFYIMAQFNNLPYELLPIIFKNLDVMDLPNCRLV